MLGTVKATISRLLPAPLKLWLRQVLRMGPPGYQVDKVSLQLQPPLQLSYVVPGSELHTMAALRALRAAARGLGRPIGGRVLELGSYGHPGLALALLVCGAEHVTLNNVVPVVNRLPVSYVTNLTALCGTFWDGPLTPGEFVRPVEAEAGLVEIRPERLTILPSSGAEAISLPDASFDFIFSVTVLEHVGDVEGVLANVCRMLKPGGWTCHDIDLRDHLHLYDAPLEFLKLSAEEFAALPGTHPNSGGNRYRKSDYQRAFAATGLEITRLGHCAPHGVDGRPGDNYELNQLPFDQLMLEDSSRVAPWVSEKLRASLHPDFHGYGLQELAVTGLQVVAVKPGGVSRDRRPDLS